MPVKSTSLPDFSRPSSAASASARGIEPDEVFPYRSYVDDGPAVRDTQFSHSVIDDADVRLVRDVDVDVLDLEPALGENRVCRGDHDARCELEDLAAVHLHVLGRRRRTSVSRSPAARDSVAAAAVGAELEPEEPTRVDDLHDDRAGAVAEEHERRAIGPVEDLGEDVSADDERALGQPRREHGVGLCDRVDEPGTAGGQVVGGGIGHPEGVGQERRRRRKRHVGRDGRDDQQVDRRRLDSRPSRAPACRRAARRRSMPPRPLRTGARGCRSAHGSTRRSCRPGSRARRSSGRARARGTRAP